MTDLIEDGMAVEKRFREKIESAIKNEFSDEIKIEQITIASGEYFTDKLKMMIRFYDDNKIVQKQLSQEKIDKEIELLEKKNLLLIFSKKELDVLKVIIKNKTWANTAMISRDTKHTWITVDKYIKKFLDLGVIEIVPKTITTRKKRFKISEDYSFAEQIFNEEKREDKNGKENKN
jgi:hypothetical protein